MMNDEDVDNDDDGNSDDDSHGDITIGAERVEGYVQKCERRVQLDRCAK